MGEVYAATDTESGEDAAIKLLQSSMLGDEQLVARFLREGEAASKLERPNVVTIFEVGTIGANGAPYIAMELLRGHDLGWHLRQRGSLPLDEVVALAEQVAARAGDGAQGRGHRAPRPQAAEPVPRPAARRRAGVEDPRLRRVAPRGVDGHADDGPDRRHARATCRRSRRRRPRGDAPQRRVLVRRRGLPRAHRAAAVLGAGHAADPLPGRVPQPGAPLADRPRAAAGRGHRAGRGAGEGPGGPLRLGARDGGGAARGGAREAESGAARARADAARRAALGDARRQSEVELEFVSAG